MRNVKFRCSKAHKAALIHRALSSLHSKVDREMIRVSYVKWVQVAREHVGWSQSTLDAPHTSLFWSELQCLTNFYTEDSHLHLTGTAPSFSCLILVSRHECVILEFNIHLCHTVKPHDTKPITQNWKPFSCHPHKFRLCDLQPQNFGMQRHSTRVQRHLSLTVFVPSASGISNTCNADSTLSASWQWFQWWQCRQLLTYDSNLECSSQNQIVSSILFSCKIPIKQARSVLTSSCLLQQPACSIRVSSLEQ